MSKIEANGIECLKRYLKKHGRSWRPSDRATFDLIVDDKYAEVKCKGKAFSKLDFVGFTPNQKIAIDQDDFIVFIVCNLNCDNGAEIIEISSNIFRDYHVEPFTMYYYYKGVFNQIFRDHPELHIAQA